MKLHNEMILNSPLYRHAQHFFKEQSVSGVIEILTALTVKFFLAPLLSIFFLKRALSLLARRATLQTSLKGHSTSQSF